MTSTSGASRKRLGIVAGAALAGIALGMGAVYGIGGFERNGQAAASCKASLAAAGRVASLVKGQVAAMVPAEKPLSVADLGFMRPDGSPARLADWAGKTVLLNLWATWCVPCRLEMPALDRVARSLAAPDFEVVTVNIDTKDPEKPKRFLEEIKVETLVNYADPTIGIFKTLQQRGRSRGMPTTMLVGPDGCEIGTMNGPAEWDHRDGEALIKAALGR
ncbi:thiol:disulfide interchange protein TlpA [Prosthecomicrobium sp. N25]|uniref:thiol:disulfide interchange protein TlpA n=1 Tax=Prosthecomicrobium sp. N25 TaxID=3129254 RepID=UPI003076E78B